MKPPSADQPCDQSIARLQAFIDEVVWYNGAEPLLWPSTVFLGLAAKGITVKHLTKHRLDMAKYRCVQETKRRLTESRLGNELDPTFDPEMVLGPDEDREKKVLQNLLRLREIRKQQSDNGNSGVDFSTILKETSMSATSTALQVNESDVRTAFTALGIEGLKDKKKWPLKRLNQKVADAEAFSDLLEKLAKPGSNPEGADKDLLSNISNTLAEHGEVVVIRDKVSETNGNSNEGKDMTTATTKKTSGAKKTTGAKRGGSKKGSLMDAAITVMKSRKSKFWRPKEVYEEIQKRGLWKPTQGKTPEATLSASMYVELKKEERSRFIKSEEGFALNTVNLEA